MAATSSTTCEHLCDCEGQIVSQGGDFTNNQVPMVGTELGLMEMTGAEFTNFQHLVQMHMDTQAGPPFGLDTTCHPGAETLKDAPGPNVVSPLTTAQVIDLSTSTETHCLVMPGENTPVSYGEVPGSVLARISGEESLIKMPTKSHKSSHREHGFAVRVCLEKRFDTMSADNLRQKDIQSAVVHNPSGGVLNLATNTFSQSQAVGHILCTVERNKHEDGAAVPHTSRNRSRRFKPKAAKPAPNSAGEPGCSTRPLSQRRERHNRNERERRKRIRLCCDELNMLVPFCDFGTDKVTTLKWTTSFLGYINKMYGDTLKKEFESAVNADIALFLNSSSQDQIHREMDNEC